MNSLILKFFICFLFILIQCQEVEKNIQVNQETTAYDVIARSASDDENSIITIQFPQRIILENSSNTEYYFISMDYEYANIPSNRNLNLGLYTENNNGLVRIRNNGKKVIPKKSKKEYIIYSRHFVDSTKFIQEELRPYAEKMISENKDTLHIGTVSEFKVKHRDLFEKLTKDDSISIRFLKGKKMGERITVPIQW